MAGYTKINGVWKLNSNYFVKENGSWASKTEAQILAYCDNKVFSYGGHIQPAVSLEVVGPDSVSAETCSFNALNGTVDVTLSAVWSITSGGTYATINSATGEVTILSNARNSNITVQASYSGSVATKTATVTYKAGSESHTETEVVVDDDGNTNTTTTTTTENSDGSSTTTSNTVITNSDGDTIGTAESNINTNSDGSFTGTTTNYDAEGNPTTGSNVTGDTSGNVNTQQLEYDESGQSIVSGYVIDTSNNPNGGEVISGGLDTGFIAFDGRPFTIHVKCNINTAEQSTNTNTLLSALEHGSSNNRYSGFSVDLYNRREIISFGGTNSQIKNAYFGSRITGTVGTVTTAQTLNYLHSGQQELIMDITYTPASYSPEWKYTIYVQTLYTSNTGGSKKNKTNSTLKSNSGYLPTSLANATITIGSYGVEHSHDAVNVEVLEFSVTKL